MLLPMSAEERIPFIPEAPYTGYSKGVAWLHPQQNRRMVNIWNSAKDNTTLSLAKYWYQTYLWKTQQYLIPQELVVDHINDFKLDDRIDNFQLLTVAQNNIKDGIRRGKLVAIIICPICGICFAKDARRTQLVPSKAGRITCCTTTCSYTFISKYNFVDRRYKDWVSINQICLVIKEHGDLIYLDKWCINTDSLNEIEEYV